MQTMIIPENVSLLVAQSEGEDVIFTCLGKNPPHWSILKKFAGAQPPEGAWWLEVERLGAGGLRVSLMVPYAYSPTGRRERSRLYINRRGLLPLGPTRVKGKDLAALLAAIPPDF